MKKKKKYGLPCYTFKNDCLENPDVNLNDKSLKVIYNSSAYKKAEDEKIRGFLHYVHTNEPGEDDFSKRLSANVKQIIENDEFRRIYASMNLHDRDLIKMATREGEKKSAMKSARNALELGLSPEQISKITSLPVEKILKMQKDEVVKA